MNDEHKHGYNPLPSGQGEPEPTPAAPAPVPPEPKGRGDDGAFFGASLAAEAVAEERRGLKRALHAVEEQALNWHKLAEDLGRALNRLLSLPGVRDLVPNDFQIRAARLLMRVERADGAEVEESGQDSEPAWASFAGMKSEFRDKLAEAVRRGHLVMADREWLDGVDRDLAELWGLDPEQLDQAMEQGHILIWTDGPARGDGVMFHFAKRTAGAGS